VGYTLICGFPPFSGASSIDVCAKKLNKEPELPEKKINASLARDLQKLLLRCLSLDPERRPQSTQRLAKDLLACVDSPHWTQQDAALWWREVFDGPYLDDFEIGDLSEADDGTQGDTAVNEKRPAASELAQSTAN
jgi:serine/threonine protein kinase